MAEGWGYKNCNFFSKEEMSGVQLQIGCTGVCIPLNINDGSDKTRNDCRDYFTSLPEVATTGFLNKVGEGQTMLSVFINRLELEYAAQGLWL